MNLFTPGFYGLSCWPGPLAPLRLPRGLFMAKACLQKSRLLNWSFFVADLTLSSKQFGWNTEAANAQSDLGEYVGQAEVTPSISYGLNWKLEASPAEAFKWPATRTNPLHRTSNCGWCSLHFICCQSFIHKNLYCVHFNGLYLATVRARYDIIGILSVLCIIKPDCCPVWTL